MLHNKVFTALVLSVCLLGSVGRADAFAVYGDILIKYNALGGSGGVLGAPLTDETGTPDGVGRYNHFEWGSIYWTPQTGAQAVWGDIRARWAELGWELGFLGYPVTDETGTPDGRGRYNHFEGGSIYWTPETGAHEVSGMIRDKWAALGWERSCLGYPIGPPEPSFTFAGAYLGEDQQFENGYVSYHDKSISTSYYCKPSSNPVVVKPVQICVVLGTC